MSENGVKTTNLTKPSMLDEVIGNRDGSTGAADFSSFAAQLAGTGAVAEALGALAQRDLTNPNKKQSVVAATTGNVALTGAYTVDDVVLTNGQRYLVGKQSSGATVTDAHTGLTNSPDNGIYIYNSAGIHPRAEDLNEAGEIQYATVYADRGTDNIGKTFYTISEVNSLGADPILWVIAMDQSPFFQPIALNVASLVAKNAAREPTGRSLLNHYWPCDEGHGTILRDEVGGVEINFADTSLSGVNAGGAISWDINGVLNLSNAWIGSPATITARTIFVVFECALLADHYICVFPRNGNNMHTKLRDLGMSKIRHISGPGIRELNYRADGNLSRGFAAGGLTAAMGEHSTTKTGPLFFNSTREDGAGSSVSPLRIYSVATSDQVLTLEQIKQVRLLLASQLAKRGHYMIPQVCPKACAVAVMSGESTHHTSLDMETDPTLSANLPLRQKPYTNLYIGGADTGFEISDDRKLQQLSYWLDKFDASGKRIGNEGYSTTVGGRASKMGPAYGFANRHLFSPTPLDAPMTILGLASGGTRLSPAGTATAGGSALGVSQSRYNNSDGSGLFERLLVTGFLKYEAELRSRGFGMKHIHHYWAEGINDAFQLEEADIATSAVYQTWMQTTHDGTKAHFGIDPLPTTVLVPHLPVPGADETEGAQLGIVPDYPNDANGQRRLRNLLKIRKACRDFAAANEDVDVREGDDYELNTANADPVHPSLLGLDDMGGDYRDDFSFADIVEAFE